ncbi:MAG: hypothetical protein ACW991_01960 [Candidatus Hodarchaeales archaeon]|jgi:phage regulator Rha-like protein
MSDLVLKEILEGINHLKKRMDRLEWLIMELKFSEVDPTPEEQKIIQQYENEKEKLEFSKLV